MWAPRSLVLSNTKYLRIQSLGHPSGPMMAGNGKATPWCQKGAGTHLMTQCGDVLAEPEPGVSLAGQDRRSEVAEGKRGSSVLSEEAQIGRRVRVREDYRTPGWRGKVGTIAKRWGDPSYTALDVLLDDGGLQLFWHHELQEIDDDGGGTL